MTQMDELLRYLRCGYSVFHIPTAEEARIHRILEKTASLHFLGTKHIFATWDIVDGWKGRGVLFPKDTVTNPKSALSFIEASGNGFYILNDFDPYLHKPEIERSLHNFCTRDATTEKFIFLVSSANCLPGGLPKEIVRIEFNPPSIEETKWILAPWIESTRNDHLDSSMGKLVLCFRGMSEPAIRHLLKGAKTQGRVEEEELLRQIYAEKKLHVSLMSDGILEFIPPHVTATQVGGLHNAKEWLEKRKHFFSNPELATRVKPPKGLLAMGVSGCGKSLLVKAIPAIWNVPLFRLKMGMVFAGGGTPEERFFRVLRILEDIAPCIVWADEFEKLFPGMDERYQSTAGSSDSRIFSEFLTFMEEKNPYLFVAATCNRIEALPAEVLRKGRFDAVFFVDLPCDDERYEILQVHMKKQGLEPGEFDLDRIVLRTKGWNGAELEELVSRVLVECLADDQPITDEVIFSHIEITKPLSLTAAEQISKMQRWALGRATPASKFSSLSRKRLDKQVDAKGQVA